MQLTPLIAIHLAAALAATAVGPVALWSRRGRLQRPRLHRAFGYAWVTLMGVTAVSAVFIRDFRLPNLAGYTPIHLFVPYVLVSLMLAFRALAQGRIAAHRKIMTGTYIGACLIAGLFTLLPGRYLGQLVGSAWLGQVLTRTPVWVWALLAALLVLGFSQARPRRVGLVRVALLPLGMAGFSLYGTASAFGASPLVLGSWLTACALLLAMVPLPVPVGARFDSAKREFDLPGSWVPMALILGIFLTKYGVGASLALHPELKANVGFSVAIAALYGVFSGVFAARAASLLRMAWRPAAAGHRTLLPS